jgi:hypothetical protein
MLEVVGGAGCGRASTTTLPPLLSQQKNLLARIKN